MTHKNIFSIQLLRFSLIIAILLFGSVKSTAQTRVSATVGAYTSGSKIPKAAFSSAPGIGVYVKDAPFEIKYTITGYTLTLADDEGNAKQVHCQGSAFSLPAKEAIKQYAKAGDIISIQNIKVKGEDGREQKLPALLYYIE